MALPRLRPTASPLFDRSVDLPRTTAELRAWVIEHFDVSGDQATELIRAIDSVVAGQRQLIEESKVEAMRALTEGFAAKMERLQQQLSEKDVTVSNIARYFEEVVAELTEKSHRDPKTKLLNFDWFMERVESFLAVEQRVRWCGVGVVDISSFKWYNDTLGHARRRPHHRAGRADPVGPDPVGRLPRGRAVGECRAICTRVSAVTSSAS